MFSSFFDSVYWNHLSHMDLDYQTSLSIMAIFGFVAVFAIAIGIFIYIISSVSYFKMARSTNTRNSAFAWFPLLRSYLIGKISDNINKQNGKSTHRAIFMFIFSILIAISSIGASHSFGHVYDGYTKLANKSHTLILNHNATAEFFSSNMQHIIILLIMSVIFIVLSVWYFIIYVLAHDSVYKKYSDGSSSVFLAFTILSPILANYLPAIFVLSLNSKAKSKKDEFTHKDEDNGDRFNSSADTPTNASNYNLADSEKQIKYNAKDMSVHDKFNQNVDQLKKSMEE